MPVERCQKDGRRGHKCGRRGTCFTDKGRFPSTSARACAVCRAQNKECSAGSNAAVERWQAQGELRRKRKKKRKRRRSSGPSNYG